MNNLFAAKLLQNLRNKKGEKGFTLIELLVVVIIIGVLAAIALPNLLGQVGKARESEAKNIVGALNRAQQSYFTERSSFANNIGLLEVPTGGAKYYTFDVPATAVQRAVNPDNAEEGTRDYVGAVQYDQTTRDFFTVVCRSMEDPDFDLSTNATATGAVNNPGSVADASSAALSCTTTAGASQTEEVR